MSSLRGAVVGMREHRLVKSRLASTGGRQWLSEISGMYLSAASILAFLIFWEVAVRVMRIPVYLLPPPSSVFMRAIEVRGPLATHAWSTIQEIMGGFGLSVVFGVLVGTFIVASGTLERILYPALILAQTVPKVALAPLFIIWLGFGIESKVVIAFLIAFFPVVINTTLGLRTPSDELIDLARSMGGSTYQVFVKIRFPSALPNIFAGLKVSSTFAVVGALVGEFVGSDRGLGYFLVVNQTMVETHNVFAAILVTAVLGMGFYAILGMLERLLIPWRQKSVEAENLLS